MLYTYNSNSNTCTIIIVIIIIIIIIMINVFSSRVNPNLNKMGLRRSITAVSV